MRIIADFHVHSKYSRACSKNLELPAIARACERKGIDVVATGDFTHPAWFAHLREQLREQTEGVFVLYDGSSVTRFVLGTEVACIYKHREATRRLHLLILAPSFEAVEKLNRTLEERGCNIRSDGRPILGLSAKELLALCLHADARMAVIPAHAWTPWFSVFGSKSGYDSLEECFEDLTPNIFAIETGLSSDPPMNWRVSALDSVALISNSDAHSLEKLGREANVFDLDAVSFDAIIAAIRQRDPLRFLHTIEFYPEEGKYHFDGHRECGVCLSPKESARHAHCCPVCGKALTLGVVNRVEQLADREQTDELTQTHIPFKSIVPLKEILAELCGVGAASKKVQREYEALLDCFGSEFNVLLEASCADIEERAGKTVAASIARMRAGDVRARPGYDGVFGSVSVFAKQERPNIQNALL